MKKHTEKNNVYKFEELSEESKDLALENYWSINVDHDWWFYGVSDAAKELGLEIQSFDLGRDWSIDIKYHTYFYKIAEDILKTFSRNWEIFKISQYFLNNIKGLDQNDEEYERLEYEYCKALENEFLNLLKAEYDFLTSKEMIKDTLVLNSYNFTKNGKIY
jgi:hypothetical protein